MNHNRFDALTRTLISVPSRRHLLRGLAGAGLGLGGTRLPDLAEAKKKRKRKKKGKKAKPNAFGCLNVGDPCKSEEQCCSGICEGKKGKKRCQAHDAGICTVGLNICTGAVARCNADNPSCGCVLTTGNAGFCGDFTDGANNLCRDCSEDTDCQEEFGPGAACVALGGICAAICPDTGTACVPACPDADM
jgi:hypothetical protein